MPQVARVAGTIVVLLLSQFLGACHKQLCDKCKDTSQCSAELVCATRRAGPNVVVIGDRGFCVPAQSADEDLTSCGAQPTPTPSPAR